MTRQRHDTLPGPQHTRACREERHARRAAPDAKAGRDRVTVRFPVEQLDCAACGGSLRTAMRSLAGIFAVAPNPAARDVAVTFDPRQVTPAAIREHLDALGLGCG